MELTLTFSIPHRQCVLPIDYQYYISAWLYGVLAKGDAEYATFLHNQGYAAADNPRKPFKLFCFSALQFDNYILDTHHRQFLLQGDTLRLRLRFCIDEALQHFVTGIFQGEALRLKTGYNQLTTFDIQSVNMAAVSVPATTLLLRTDTPLVIARPRANHSEEYLSPEHEGYATLFIDNLLAKYKVLHDAAPPDLSPESLHFAWESRYPLKPALVTIPKGNAVPIKVKGYRYTFRLTAPTDLLHLGLLAGFGKSNSMGFGFTEVVQPTNLIR